MFDAVLRDGLLAYEQAGGVDEALVAGVKFRVECVEDEGGSGSLDVLISYNRGFIPPVLSSP